MAGLGLLSDRRQNLARHLDQPIHSRCLPAALFSAKNVYNPASGSLSCFFLGFRCSRSEDSGFEILSESFWDTCFQDNWNRLWRQCHWGDVCCCIQHFQWEATINEMVRYRGNRSDFQERKTKYMNKNSLDLSAAVSMGHKENWCFFQCRQKYYTIVHLHAYFADVTFYCSNVVFYLLKHIWWCQPYRTSVHLHVYILTNWNNFSKYNLLRYLETS